MDELEAHIRWVVEDAGLIVSEAAIQASLEQGGGSARDTLSALELAASVGGDDLDVVRYDEFVEALIEHDPGRALTAVAYAVQQGRDPRSLTEDVVRHLRDCFLSLMAPELVALPDQKAAVVAEQAGRLGAGRLVRAMEKLGEILVEMRHAPDARLLLEVAFVQLTHVAAASDVGALMDRIDRLEQAVAGGIAAAPAAPVVPVDPATGRVQLGGGARRGPEAPPAAKPVAGPPTVAVTPTVVVTPTVAVTPTVTVAAVAPPVLAAVPDAHADTDPSSALDQAVARWSSDIVPSLKMLVRAIYSVPRLLGARDGRLALGAPNDAHRARCEQHRADVESAIAAVVGRNVELLIVTDSGASDDHEASHDAFDSSHPVNSGPAGTSPSSGGAASNVVPLRPGGQPTAEEDIDLNDLVDAPPESVVTPIERLAQAFPGSELIDERR
jgi:DNA polymerase-3 subunit gamma/tau